MTLLTHARRRTVGAVAAAAALTLTATLAPIGAATATPQPAGPTQAVAKGRTVDVMSRNLYLGAGLTEIVTALGSGNNAAIVQAASQTWQVVQASDPEERMAALADEIAAARPAVVGLQEVTTWTTYPYNPMTGEFGEATVAYDFLELLLAELAERGVAYEEVQGATAYNFTSPQIPVVTTAPPYPTEAVSIADRDVILRRPGVKVSNAQSGNFETLLPLGGLIVDRGWGSADVRANGARFRFVNAHTEAFGPEAIRVGEVMELFAAQDAITEEYGALPTVYVGDYNTSADDPADTAYSVLTDRLTDAWEVTNGDEDGFTCCQLADLSNPTSVLDERIDYVLTTDDVRAKSTYLTGTTPIDLPGETWWASDHAGVVAKLVIGPRATR